LQAHQIMSRHVITIGADASVADAINLMLTHRISGLPVVDAKGALSGIVSQGDFVRRVELGTEKCRNRWLSLLAGGEQVAIDFTRQNGRRISQVMTPEPITIGEDTSLEQIVRMMESRNIHRFPVMRGNKIVGMVTRGDFLTALAGFSIDALDRSDIDEQIRKSAIVALSSAPWRPCALNVSVHDGVVTVRGTVKTDNARKAALVAVENIAGVKRVEDQLLRASYPPPEEDYGGGDFVSLQTEPSTADDEPL
jgi:CBS domain-containing protein